MTTFHWETTGSGATRAQAQVCDVPGTSRLYVRRMRPRGPFVASIDGVFVISAEKRAIWRTIEEAKRACEAAFIAKNTACAPVPDKA